MSLKVHFAQVLPPAYSPPPSYSLTLRDEDISFTQLEHMASIAEHKLGYLVSQKRREPSLRRVLLHATFLERVLDKIDSVPAPEEQVMAVEYPAQGVPARTELHPSLNAIPEELELDEEEMPPLERTVSHRPGSPVSDEEDDDSDEEYVPPPPSYSPPLIDLYEVREKARREDIPSQYVFPMEQPHNMFFMNSLVAAA
jgi:hypothetical protein